MEAVTTTGIGRNDMPAEIASAISVVKSKIGKIKRSGKYSSTSRKTGQVTEYTFASIDDIYEAVRKIMADAGLSVLSREISMVPSQYYEGCADFVYDFVLIHASGATYVDPLMRRSVPAVPVQGPQTSGKAQSYAEKTFLKSMLKLSTGDLDGDDVGGEVEIEQAPEEPEDLPGEPETPVPEPHKAAKGAYKKMDPEAFWHGVTFPDEPGKVVSVKHKDLEKTIRGKVYAPHAGKWLEQNGHILDEIASFDRPLAARIYRYLKDQDKMMSA